MYKKLILLFLAFFCFNIVFSQTYYADIKINVDNTGLVKIDGTSNYDLFNNISTQEYTSKNGESWILNISVNETFSDYIYELSLPENSVINYIKTTPNVRFDTQGSKFLIIGIDSNNNFELIVQYQVKSTNGNSLDDNSNEYIFLFLYVTIFILIFLIFYLIYFFKTRKNSNNYSDNDSDNHTKDNTKNDINEDKSDKIDYSYLPERQKQILDILDKKSSISQKELEKLLDIPKSSVSRNINSLYVRNLINKKSIGNTNILSKK